MAFYTLCAITLSLFFRLVKSCSCSSTACYVYVKVIFHIVWKSNISNCTSSFAAYVARCVSYLSSCTLAVLIGLVVEIVSILYFSRSFPDFYRHVLVFVPFSATALGIFTIAVMLLLKWCCKGHISQVIIRAMYSVVGVSLSEQCRGVL